MYLRGTAISSEREAEKQLDLADHYRQLAKDANQRAREMEQLAKIAENSALQANVRAQEAVDRCK